MKSPNDHEPIAPSAFELRDIQYHGERTGSLSPGEEREDAGRRALYNAGRASRDAELRALAAEYRRAADKAVHPNLCDECTAPLQRAYGAFADKLLALLDGQADGDGSG